MLPGELLDTLQVVAPTVPTLVPIPNSILVETMFAVSSADWGYAGASDQPMFPVPANQPQRIPYDTKLGFWIQGTGTVIIALFGAAAVPGYGGRTTLLVPTSTVAPAISGTTTVGSTLTSTHGTWTGTLPFAYTYQWQREGVDIGGATASTYVVVLADVGDDITCIVTATNAVGSVPATSNTLLIPFTTTTWNNGDGDNLAVNALNWSHGLTSASVGAIFNDAVTTDTCDLPASPDDLEVASINAGNFSGILGSSSSAYQDAIFNVYGDVTLNAAIQTSRKIQLQIVDDCDLTTGGFLKMALVSTATGKDLNLLDNVSARLVDLANINLDFGVHTISFTDAAGSNGGCSILGGTTNWSTGAKIIITTSTTMVLALADAPPIEMKAGAGTTQIDDVLCESFRMEAGALAGTGARTLGIGTSFVATGGTSLTGPLAVTVGGLTATATGLSGSITDMDFSGGATLTATDVTNGGGNTNVTFVETASPVVLTNPSIAGSTPVGSTLTATPGTASGINVVRTGQWYQDGVAIGGETALTYVTVTGDASTTITYKDIWTNSHGATTSGASNGITVAAPPLTYDTTDTYPGITLSNGNLSVAIAGTTEHVLRVSHGITSGVYGIVFSAANDFGNAIVGFQASTTTQVGDFLPHNSTRRGLQGNGDRWLCIINADNSQAGTSPNIPAGNCVLYKNAVLQVGPNPMDDWSVGATMFAAVSTLDHTVTAPVITMDVLTLTGPELAILALYGASAYPG